MSYFNAKALSSAVTALEGARQSLTFVLSVQLFESGQKSGAANCWSEEGTWSLKKAARKELNALKIRASTISRAVRINKLSMDKEGNWICPTEAFVKETIAEENAERLKKEAQKIRQVINTKPNGWIGSFANAVPGRLEKLKSASKAEQKELRQACKAILAIIGE